LGLTSLVITDLDACQPTEVPLAKGGTTIRNKKAKPKREARQVTANTTLKSWHPKLTDIDALLTVNESGHYMCVENEYDLYVAYQKAVADPTKTDGEELIPRTFEDALVYANFTALKDISGSSTTNKIAALVNDELSGDELESALFEIVDSAEKAAFAIDCLVAIEDGSALSPPRYIEAGLKWLQEKLEEPALSVVDTGVVVNG
jgi:hypothetical protein